MTLQQFFDVLSNNPEIVLFYFIALPLTAFLLGVFGKGEGHKSPWSYAYCCVVYLATIPGIFAVLLNVYFFLFERQSILQANIFTQFLPMLTMVVTLLLIRRNVSLDLIPGFGKITGLILIVGVLIAGMWILDRTHIIAITILPFQYVLLILVALLVLMRVGWSRVIAK